MYSKVMCWVALDRAIALAGKLGAEDRLEGWQRTRDDIHAAVLRHGWSQRAGAFTPARWVPGTTLLPLQPGLPGVMRVTWYRFAATFGRR